MTTTGNFLRAKMQKSSAPLVDARTLAERKADAAGEAYRKKRREQGIPDDEIGGPKGLPPTRYGDWEKAGRCFDF